MAMKVKIFNVVESFRTVFQMDWSTVEVDITSKTF